MHCQPAEDIDQLIQLFRQRNGPPDSQDGSKTLHVDATERGIGRNLDDAAQRDDYNGKHGWHCLKNTVLCDEFQFIFFMGPTWNGSMHDRAMIEEELPSLEALAPYQLWF